MAKSQTYVLVKWVEEDSWDVLPLHNSVKPISADKKILNTTVDYYWKKGEESSPCTILAYGKMKDMEKKRNEEVENHSEATLSVMDPAELGVGRRAIKKPFKLTDDAGDDQPQPKKQKLQPSTSTTATSHSILQQLSVRQPVEAGIACKCEKYSKLKEKYQELKIERDTLKLHIQELTQYKDLTTIINDLKQLKREMSASSDEDMVDLPCSPPPRVTPAASAPAPPPTPSTVSMSGLVTPPVKPQVKVDIGHGVLLSKGQLSGIIQSSGSGTKLARNLFMALFGRNDVLGKSLTGKKSNAHLTTSESKAVLDPVKINAIVDFTVRKYPNIPATVLKQSLANKIKEWNQPRREEQ